MIQVRAEILVGKDVLKPAHFAVPSTGENWEDSRLS
jgi:hypothetical protein